MDASANPMMPTAHPTDIQILLASIGGLFVTLGVGSKWLLMYIEQKQV